MKVRGSGVKVWFWTPLLAGKSVNYNQVTIAELFGSFFLLNSELYETYK
jgi:hypothetical protein